jgi:hypothetical protein
MNKINFTFLLSVLVGFAHGVFCMSPGVKLNPLEKKILLDHVMRVGTEAISKELAQAQTQGEQRSGSGLGACLVIESTFYLRDAADMDANPLAFSVFEIIAKHEEEQSYVSEQKGEHTNMAPSNNTLGHYTEYLRVTNDENDENETYVKVISTFTDKKVLKQFLGSLVIKEQEEAWCLLF